MNNFIKQVIEEKFISKAQQRFFYSQAGKGGKKGKKWSKWAKEFSDKTDFSKLPDKSEEKEVDEIVDKNGNFITGKKSTNFNSKGVTDDWIADEVVKAGAGSMGKMARVGGNNTLRYWAESDMSKALGYNDTLAKDVDYKDAEEHFIDDLGIDDSETEERLAQMGYDKKLPEDKVRLVEDPKKFMEEYIESIINKKSKENDIISKDNQIDEKEINPIIIKQIKSLKNTMSSHNLTLNDIIKHLKDNE